MQTVPALTDPLGAQLDLLTFTTCADADSQSMDTKGHGSKLAGFSK